MFTDINIHPMNNKTDHISEKYIFHETDPRIRIRIRIKMKRIRTTDFNQIFVLPLPTDLNQRSFIIDIFFSNANMEAK